MITVRYTHASCNAILLVWGLLKLALIIGVGASLAGTVLTGHL